MKPLFWMGPTLEDLKACPGSVRQRIGYALEMAQKGEKHGSAKPLKGFKGAGVLEVISDFDGDTWRAAYTVRIKSAIYVLHVFQKKSKAGIATPKRDMELIESRLRLAIEHAKDGDE